MKYMALRGIIIFKGKSPARDYSVRYCGSGEREMPLPNVSAWVKRSRIILVWELGQRPLQKGQAEHEQQAQRHQHLCGPSWEVNGVFVPLQFVQRPGKTKMLLFITYHTSKLLVYRIEAQTFSNYYRSWVFQINFWQALSWNKNESRIFFQLDPYIPSLSTHSSPQAVISSLRYHPTFAHYGSLEEPDPVIFYLYIRNFTETLVIS